MSLSGRRASDALRRIRSGGWSQHKRTLQQVSHDGLLGAFDATDFDDAEFTGPGPGRFDAAHFGGAWFTPDVTRPTAKFDRHFFDRAAIAFD